MNSSRAEKKKRTMTSMISLIVSIGATATLFKGTSSFQWNLGTLLSSAKKCDARKSHNLAHCIPFPALFSLRGLVEEISVSDNSSKGPRTVFVGGKGGVGKTSISSALAVELASTVENRRILVVSTDPAHSLGDALDVDLRSAEGKPVMLSDPLTRGNLFACEIDPNAALESFRQNLNEFDVDKLANSLGVSSSLLESLGLREFSGLLNNPPPGFDELVALSNVLDDTAPTNADFRVIIVDTAPTGHTLRLLALPTFLDGLLGKLIELRMKLAGVASTLQALFGNSDAMEKKNTLENALNKLEDFRKKISDLRKKLQDPNKTNFVVVTVPTIMGVAETERLIQELTSQGVSITDVVVNQCVTKGYDVNAVKDSKEIALKQYERRRNAQMHWISELQKVVDEVSASEEYRLNNGSGDNSPIRLTKVPFFDAELVGVPALTYVGNTVFKENDGFSQLISTVDKTPKFVICGGKGGVGKTTTSTSLAVTMANAGHKVALVSTDPAHSVGDAIQVNLSGGDLVEIPLFGSLGEGSLSAMEIDPTAALEQFKKIIDSLIKSDATTQGDGSAEKSFGSTLRSLGEIFDTLPAGTDEVVALAKVIGLVKKGGFSRIVLDTAPTGHTLRMLSTPAFIAELIDRVLMVADKVNSNPTVKMFLSGAAAARGVQRIDDAADSAKAALLSFQLQMYDLEDMFSNEAQTEFLIVTIPTQLAVRESIRLLNDLSFEAMPIKVRNIVVNQILGEDDSQSFASRVADGQARSIQQLQRSIDTLEKPPLITKVTYLDSEPRGVFGLKALANEMLLEELQPATT